VGKWILDGEDRDSGEVGEDIGEGDGCGVRILAVVKAFCGCGERITLGSEVTVNVSLVSRE
jgi:hypothetical protein